MKPIKHVSRIIWIGKADNIGLLIYDERAQGLLDSGCRVRLFSFEIQAYSIYDKGTVKRLMRPVGNRDLVPVTPEALAAYERVFIDHRHLVRTKDCLELDDDGCGLADLESGDDKYEREDEEYNKRDVLDNAFGTEVVDAARSEEEGWFYDDIDPVGYTSDD